MSNIIQIKRHISGAGYTPVGLYSGEMVFDCVTQKLYIGNGDNGGGVATSITVIGGNGSFIQQSMLGVAGGIPQLDSNGHLPTSYLSNLFTGLAYKGVWDANANSPVLKNGQGTSGWFYKVSVAGTTSLDGTNSWSVGDTLLFDGTEWAKIGSGQAAGTNSGIQSINGYTSSSVTLHASDLSDITAAALAFLSASSVLAQRAALGIDTTATVADANYGVTGGIDFNVQLIGITAPRVITLDAATKYNPGTKLLIGDRSGNVTSTNTLTIGVSGQSNKINGQTSFVMSQSFGQVFLECDGVSKYTVITAPMVNTAPAVIDGGSI